MSNHKKVSLSLEADVVSVLTRTSRRMGMTRSALANMILKDASGFLEQLYENLPDQPDDADMKRLRGKSIDIITKQYVKSMKGLGGGDLFED